MQRIMASTAAGSSVLCLMLAALGGCPADDGDQSGIYNNTTDATNRGATYVGSAACSACHPDVAQVVTLHAHSHALTKVAGAPPEFPDAAEPAEIPNPPPGLTWNDVSYVIAGYLRGANFLDADGFVLTNGTAGTNTQYDLKHPPTGTPAGFVPYLPSQTTPLPFDFDCFRCHTTGAQAQSAENPGNQDGRPGILGTWIQDGVRCEACHGPGSNHVPNPSARDLYVNSGSAACAQCHAVGSDLTVVPASGGYVHKYTQSQQLRASGGHARFDCGVCHDPHASSNYDRDRGIRNGCTGCHSDMNMAGHTGRVFTRGDYVEPLACESCHMPFVSASAITAGPGIVGLMGRMGDTRGHIFRIRPTGDNYTAMFTQDGSRVVTDSSGRADVTLDFVCLRCHTDETAAPNSAFSMTLEAAGNIAAGLHSLP